MMGKSKKNKNKDGEKESKHKTFFVEGSSSSGSELQFSFNNQHHSSSSAKRAPRITRGHSPPLVLAFSLSAGQALQDGSPSPTSRSGVHLDHNQEPGYSDEKVEEWMILGGEEQDGDRNIQLNLGYWSTSSSENDSGNEDQTTNSVDHLWAVSEKDKSGRDQPLPRYYCTPDRFLTCHNCNKTGHLAKSCPSPKRRLTCILCGIQGHLQKGCPGLHCRTCGLPSHYRRPCPEPPVWNQVCRRCGMTGHISDACPDTWRQYHLTTQLEAPLRPRIGHTFKPIRRSTQCYNCSERGHYGFECTKGRMVSGTFPTLPFVCQYDTKEDILKLHARTQAKAKELLSERHSCRSQKARGRDGKTWPEKRRERREMKKLRREAQARREGGLVGRSRAGSDNEGYPADPFEIPSHGHRHPTPPPQKKRRMNEEWGGVRNSSKKSREAERWKKRGGTKRGYLYPHGDLGAMDDNLLSPKHRVRHRRS